ncbi:hypothetical protein GCM10011414_10420 [Croceivirga lutea]|nr:hypothetical protein GCM10011414_10420 [Croceivirga lutea]
MYSNYLSSGSGGTAYYDNLVVRNLSAVPPSSCKDVTLSLGEDGTVGLSPTAVLADGLDASDYSSIVLDVSEFDCSSLGANTVNVTLTATDGSVTSCSSVVTVVDTIAPVISCVEDIVVSVLPGECTAVVAVAEPSFSDNCGSGLSISSSGLPTDGIFPVGSTVVTYTATDASGNSNSCSVTVTVNDSDVPTAVCTDISLEVFPEGSVSITASDIDGGSTDACGSVSLSASKLSFSAIDEGANAVELTVTDASGNTSSCTATVTVTVSDVPLSCPDYLENDDPIIVLPEGQLVAGMDEVSGTNEETNGSYCGVVVTNTDTGQPWSRYRLPIVLADHGISAGDELFIGIDGNDGTGNARVEIVQNNTPNSALGSSNFGSSWSRYETTISVPSGLSSIDIWMYSNYIDYGNGGTSYYDNLTVINLSNTIVPQRMEQPNTNLNSNLQTDFINLITVSPNPASEFIEVALNASISSGSLTIFDYTGRRITEIQYTQNQSNPIRIDVTDYQDGIYMINLNSDGYQETKQFIIKKN